MQREVLESYKMFKYFWINKLKGLDILGMWSLLVYDLVLGSMS